MGIKGSQNRLLPIPLYNMLLHCHVLRAVYYSQIHTTLMHLAMLSVKGICQVRSDAVPMDSIGNNVLAIADNQEDILLYL